MAEAVGFEPTNELPRYRISSAGRYDHFDTLPYFDVEKPLRSGHNRHAVRIAMTTSIHFRIFDVDKPLRSGHNRHAVRIAMTTSIHFRIFDVEKPLRSGHNRHAVRIAMTTSIHFLIENIYRVSAWFIIVYKIYFCNKFCTTRLLLLTICGFSMPTMLDGRENRRIIIYHIYY